MRVQATTVSSFRLLPRAAALYVEMPAGGQVPAALHEGWRTCEVASVEGSAGAGHVQAMKVALNVLVTIIIVTLVAGCAGIPQDGRYQTHDRGASNNTMAN
jgi:hypothetical protein